VKAAVLADTQDWIHYVIRTASCTSFSASSLCSLAESVIDVSALCAAVCTSRQLSCYTVPSVCSYSLFLCLFACTLMVLDTAHQSLIKCSGIFTVFYEYR